MELIFFILFISILAATFFALKKNEGTLAVVAKDDRSLHDLKKRYANGEITKKEYETLKKYL